MQTTKLSSKGQVVIPKSLRDKRGWGPGTEFEIAEVGGVVTLRPSRAFAPSQLDDVAGCLAYDGPKVALADMDAAVLHEARRRSS